jgi:MFS family permease
LGLSNSQYGIILFCFLLGMAVFQVPNGLLMDGAGARRGLTLIVFFWSIASFLHSAARSVLHFRNPALLPRGGGVRQLHGRIEAGGAAVPGTRARPGGGHLQ